MLPPAAPPALTFACNACSCCAADGDAVQAALKTITNVSTVPQVFIGGKFMGGCDGIHAMHKDGQLKASLQTVSITIA